jgi:hypothetical protein
MRADRARATLVVLGCLWVGCRRDAAPRPDPATSASAQSSASAAPSVAPSAAPSAKADDGAPSPPYECFDGRLRRSFVLARPTVDAGVPVEAADAGELGSGFGTGLGLSGVGGGSGDIVVDSGTSMGPFGGLHAPAAPEDPHVTTRLVSPVGVSGLAAARALCAAGPEMQRCAASASTPTKPAREKVRYALEIRGDGTVVGSKLVAGTLGDPALGGCLVRALGASSFAAGTPKVIVEVEIGPEVKPTLRLREDGPTLTGKLPEVVVKRIIRAHFPRLRACYEGLRARDESAAGTVTTTFGIDASGAVTGAKAAAGSITEPMMRRCVQAVFASMSFPQPDAGTVSVTWPIAFSAE